MLKRDWGIGVAIGLIVGMGLTILILVWWYGISCSPGYPCSYHHNDESYNGSIWYDTAAQWIGAATSLFVAVFTFITILLVRQAVTTDNAALGEAKLQTTIARQLAVMENPPRIDVQQVRMEIIADVGFSGSCYVVNCGPHWARVIPPVGKEKRIRSKITVIYTDEPLPQRHLLEDMTYAYHVLDAPWSDDWINPGEAKRWKFEIKSLQISSADIKRIIDPKDRMALYVLGLIRYSDDLDSPERGWGNHRTLFCRKYCPIKNRYLPVQDDYYEYKS